MKPLKLDLKKPLKFVCLPFVCYTFHGTKKVVLYQEIKVNFPKGQDYLNLWIQVRCI